MAFCFVQYTNTATLYICTWAGPTVTAEIPPFCFPEHWSYNRGKVFWWIKSDFRDLLQIFAFFVLSLSLTSVSGTTSRLSWRFSQQNHHHHVGDPVSPGWNIGVKLRRISFALWIFQKRFFELFKESPYKKNVRWVGTQDCLLQNCWAHVYSSLISFQS